jgi:hypothetical protein
MEYNPITLYCPRCGRRTGQWDGRSTVDIVLGTCKKCRKRIVYDLETGDINVKPLPARNCSSGMTFY